MWRCVTCHIMRFFRVLLGENASSQEGRFPRVRFLLTLRRQLYLFVVLVHISVENNNLILKRSTLERIDSTSFQSVQQTFDSKNKEELANDTSAQRLTGLPRWKERKLVSLKKRRGCQRHVIWGCPEAACTSFPFPVRQNKHFNTLEFGPWSVHCVFISQTKFSQVTSSSLNQMNASDVKTNQYSLDPPFSTLTFRNVSHPFLIT